MKLTYNETNFLELLIFNKDKVSSYNEIIKYIWQGKKTPPLYSIKNLIKNLRKKLPYNIVKNIYGIGYKLIPFEKLSYMDSDYYEEIHNNIKSINIQNEELLKANLELQNRLNDLKEFQNFFIKNMKFNIINELMNNIAHQWKQPLSVISIASSGVKLKLNNIGVDNEDVNFSLSAIENETMYLSKIIEKFSNFFKIDYEKEFFDLSKSINYAIYLVKDSFRDYNINLLIELESNFKIYSYFNTIKQVIYYILINAKESVLKTQKSRKKIKITLKEDEYNFIIKVCDNGIGIKKELIDKICEPYFSTKFSKKGIGLSLYTCKLLIENQLNGEFLVQSSKTKTEFTIKIPKK